MKFARVAKNILKTELLYVAIAGAATQAVTIFSGILISQYLGVIIFGQYLLIQGAVQAFLVLSSFGNINTVSRYTAIYRQRDPFLLERALHIIRILNVFSILLSIIFLILYGKFYIIDHDGKSNIEHLLWISSPSIVFLTFDLYYKGIIIADKKSTHLALGSIITATFTFASTLIALQAGSLEVVIGAITFSTFIQCYISRKIANRKKHNYEIPQHKSGPVAVKMIFNHSLPTMLAGATVQPVHWLMQNWLGGHQNAFSEIAVFGICIQWLAILMFLPMQFSKVLLPRFSEASYSSNGSEITKLLVKSVMATAIYAAISSLILVVTAPLIASFYGAPEQQLVFCLRITAVAALISILQSPLGSYLNSKDSVWSSFRINLIWAVSYIAVALYLKGMGAAGFLVAMTIAYIFTILLIVLSLWIKRKQDFVLLFSRKN